MHHRLTHAFSIFTGLTLLAGCAAEAASDEPDELPATAEFSTAPLEPSHESITVSALGFLRADMLALVVLGNTSTDAAFVLDNATHFDDCNFSGGATRIRNAQRDAVRALNPRQVNERQAALLFARSLHSAQDFYAHSNWVELGGTELVDSSLGAFPALTPYSTLGSSGFVVVEGAVPAELALQRDVEAPYPDYAVVYASDPELDTRGLISGTVDYEPGNKCPSELALTHEELNKDRSSESGRRAQHEAAMALAIRQTRHEWCRLQELTRVAHGEAGVRRLNSWVRKGASAPVCGGE